MKSDEDGGGLLVSATENDHAKSLRQIVPQNKHREPSEARKAILQHNLSLRSVPRKI
jgi:hypothetical protein